MVTVTGLRCEEGRHNGIVAVAKPRLSWRLESERRGVAQTAYQIRVEDEAGEVWNTGRVESDQSTLIPYGGAPLQSRKIYTWWVRVWDESGEMSEWSEAARWETSLLSSDEWRARWIDPEGEIDPEAFKPCPYLRTIFTLSDAPVTRARAYVTCLGVYEFSINGRVVGDDVLAPGFTNYEKYLQYQTYRLDALLHAGENVVGVILGDGWYRGKLGVFSHRNVYGERVALLLQIHIQYADGSEQIVMSDNTWKTHTGPILKSDMKDGEIYDARLEMPGWDTPGFDDSEWQPVRVVDYPNDNLVGASGPPTRRHETFIPTILHTPNGQTVLDFGQNIAGRVRMRVQGPAGATVRLQHGETLDKDGNFTLSNLNIEGFITRVVKLARLDQSVAYTLKGDGVEVYEPRFTFHGFRYALLEGFPGQPQAGDFMAIALYSDMGQTGHFECSNPLINRLNQNIEWSLKGNFLEIPTDCPQRERAGWTGDAQVFARTASFIMDTMDLMERWLRDLATEQHDNGLVPNLIPHLTRPGEGGLIDRTGGSSGWGDAAVIIPWTLYQCYGDTQVLENQYASMKAWVDFMTESAKREHWSKRINPARLLGTPEHQPYIWDAGYHWGEWLEPDVSINLTLPRNFVLGHPSVATAFYAYSSGLMAETARVLGKTEDAAHYADLSEKVKAAWVKEFARADGRLTPDRQATYVRALAFDLLPESMRPAAAQRLVELIKAKDDHLFTGFLSTSFLCHVLARYGHLDTAYTLLNQQTPPSWLYPVTKGATTIWEFWEVIKPDGTVTMGSLNHYSPGAVGSWLYQGVAGIEIGAPGYKHIHIQPQPGGGLTSARATYQSPHGTIESAWEIAQKTMTLHVIIPPNTTATVHLPGAAVADTTESGQPLSVAPGITQVATDGGGLAVDIGSGHYLFTWPND